MKSKLFQNFKIDPLRSRTVFIIRQPVNDVDLQHVFAGRHRVSQQHRAFAPKPFHVRLVSHIKGVSLPVYVNTPSRNNLICVNSSGRNVVLSNRLGELQMENIESWMAA